MPKGGATSLIPVSAGLRADLDMFLKAFLELRTVRFTDYKKLFQQRGIIELHNGRSESAEIIEFNEQLLIHCLPYIKEYVTPGMPRSLEERLFGLYSLYTFFYTQAVGHVVKIRVDPDTSLSFRRLMDLVLKQQILDAYMACLKLFEDQAFKHVAFLPVYDPALFKRFGDEDQISKCPVHINPNDPLARIKSLQQSKDFQKLQVMHHEYSLLKMKAGIDIDASPMRTVEDSLQEILNNKCSTKIIKQEIVTPVPSSNEKPKSSRSEIKERAYQSQLILSRTRRHCTAADMDIQTEAFDFDTVTREPEVIPTKRIKTEPREACEARSPTFEDSGISSASSISLPPVLYSQSSSSASSIISVKKEVISDDDYIAEQSAANTSTPVTPKSILRRPGLVKSNEIKRRIKFLGMEEVHSDDEYFDAPEASGKTRISKSNKAEVREVESGESSHNSIDTEMVGTSCSPRIELPPQNASGVVNRVKPESWNEPKDEETANDADDSMCCFANISVDESFVEVDEIMDLSSEDEGILSINTDF